MAAGQRPIVVGINDSPDAEAGLRWALDDARARNAAVRLVYSYRWDYMYTRIPPYADVPYLDVPQSRKVAEQVVGRMVDLALESTPAST